MPIRQRPVKLVEVGNAGTLPEEHCTVIPKGITWPKTTWKMFIIEDVGNMKLRVFWLVKDFASNKVQCWSLVRTLSSIEQWWDWWI